MPIAPDPARLLAGVMRLPLAALPPGLLSAVIAHGANHLLRGQALAARVGELDGRTVGIEITDRGRRLDFTVAGGRLLPAHGAQADVVISGALDAFAALATRAEDADALFFHGRLSMAGDTATGVHVKNLLDALDYDWDAHFLAVLPPGLARLASGLRRRVHARVERLRRGPGPRPSRR